MDVPLHTMKIFKLLHIQSAALEQIKVRLNVLDGKSRCAPRLCNTATLREETF